MIVQKQVGFTLLEMLVAVMITALIGVGVWKVMSTVIESKERVEQHSDRFAQFKKTMILLERDIYQVVHRTTRDSSGRLQPSLSTRGQDYDLQLVRQGWRNPLALRRSTLQKVAWRLSTAGLERLYWPHVDAGSVDSEPRRFEFPDVTFFEVRFLNENDQWVSQWPNDAQWAERTWEYEVIPHPKAIEVRLEHEVFGDIRRVFAMPDFTVDKLHWWES